MAKPLPRLTPDMMTNPDYKKMQNPLGKPQHVVIQINPVAAHVRKITPPDNAEEVKLEVPYFRSPCELPANTKYCPKCYRVKPIEQFRLRKDNNGHLSTCKKHDCEHGANRSNCKLCWLARQIKENSGLDAMVCQIR